MPISRRALFTLDFERPARPIDRLVRVHRTAMACRVEVALSEEDARHVTAARAALDEADRVEALLYDEGSDGRSTAVEVSGIRGGAAIDASETKPANNATTSARTPAAPVTGDERASATENEISAFCPAVRVGSPLRCGPDRGFDSARACIAACEAAKQKTRLTI